MRGIPMFKSIIRRPLHLNRPLHPGGLPTASRTSNLEAIEHWIARIQAGIGFFTPLFGERPHLCYPHLCYPHLC